MFRSFMKKALFVSILSCLVLVLVVAPQVSALEIEITNAGVVHFYQDGVLGDDTDEEKPERGEKPERAERSEPFRTTQARGVGGGPDRFERQEDGVNVSTLKSREEINKLGPGMGPNAGGGFNTSNSPAMMQSFDTKEETKAERIRAVAPAGPSEA